MRSQRFKENAVCYGFVALGSALYALSTVLFIFPNGLLLGGTSGISVILTSVLNSSPGMILTGINVALLVLALIVLGKTMAIKTFVGSTLTTAFIALFEKWFTFDAPLVASPLLSALIGASIIAVASGVMFYFDSSSGGTDIVALIVKKYVKIDIGKALLVTDVLIVAVGGILSGWVIGVCSFVGLLVKTLGIDFVIGLVRKLKPANTAS